ncbi:type II secretion system GspH family protein [Candidatus Gracilibacteria bacterium]|nr:type II secretion system GspH family protein [Candidatus Gracilibacteria bacterium]
MKKYTKYSGFTLIELIVSIAIFGIMMISVMSIFLFSSQMSTRVEINRVMQENIKNVMEDIAEGVRKENISGIQSSLSSDCNLLPSPTTSTSIIKEGDIFCTNTHKYTLGTKLDDGSFVPVSSIDTNCGYDDANPSTVINQCYLIKVSLSGGDYYPLTNSFVTFEDIEFIISNTSMKKLTVNFTIRPAIGKGLASNLVRQNAIQVQTTISERFIETN